MFSVHWQRRVVPGGDGPACRSLPPAGHCTQCTRAGCKSAPSSTLCWAGGWQRSLNKNLRPKMATEQPQYLRNPVYVNGPGDQLSAIWCSTDRTSDHPDRERGTRCEGGSGPGSPTSTIWCSLIEPAQPKQKGRNSPRVASRRADPNRPPRILHGGAPPSCRHWVLLHNASPPKPMERERIAPRKETSRPPPGWLVCRPTNYVWTPKSRLVPESRWVRGFLNLL